MYTSNEQCKLVIEVVEVDGRCPVLRLGDRIVVREPSVVLEESTAMCTRTLPVLMSFMMNLSHERKPSDEPLFVKCPEPGEPYSEYGRVIFKVTRFREGDNA